jgi:hypothetical protein
MKTIVTFFFCTFLPLTFFAQDIVVKSTGEKINCKIVETDSSFISFTGENSGNEISLVPKENILAVKRDSQNFQLFFIPDTLVTENGNEVVCKIVEIDPTLITYLPVDSAIGDLTMVMSSKFVLIRLGDGSQEVVKSKQDNSADQLSSMDYYKMGRKDALVYYKCPYAVAGEIASGIGTYFMGFGLIPAVIIYATPPAQLSNLKNPNNDLLASNKDYYSGYLEQAKKIKHKRCGIAYGATVLAPVAIVVGAVTLMYAE